MGPYGVGFTWFRYWVDFRCFPGVGKVRILNVFFEYVVNLYYCLFGEVFSNVAVILSSPLLLGSFLISGFDGK